MKKIFALVSSITLVMLFWYLVGEVFILKDDKNSFSKLECVSYAPFDKDQSPFSLAQGMVVSRELVKKDLELLSKYTGCIRTYSTVGLEIVPEIAREYNLKMYMGAWVSSDKAMTKKELDTLIKLAKENRDLLKGVIVGNEVLLRGDTSEAVLADYIKYVKAALKDIEVTYADVWEFWVKHPQIKEVTDFVTIHILPYWEDDPTNISHSIEHLAKVRGEVGALLGNKKILIGETGWPSEGRAREDAYPSKVNQALFVREFVKLAQKEGWNYNIIEAFDQPWKRVSEGAVGGFWGLFDKDRGDKNVFRGNVSNFDNYLPLMAGSLSLVLLFSLLLRKAELGVKEIGLFSGLNTVFAVLYILALEQYSVTVRTAWEFIWAFFVMFVHILIYYFALSYIAYRRKPQIISLGEIFQKKIKGPDSSMMILFYLSFISVLVINLALAFEGRYRNFEVYAFAISALSYLILYAGRFESMEFSKFEKASFIALVLTSSAIFVNETYLNMFSNIWLLIALAYAYMLYFASKKISYGKLASLAMYSILFLLFFAYVKYGFIANKEFVSACALKNDVLCKFRESTAYYLYLGRLGIAALLVAAVAYFSNTVYASAAALFLSLGAVLLNNASLGAFVLVLSIYIFTRDFKDKKHI